jgi:tetrahydromethanopterin S-methyltransferase subunit D
MDSTDRQSTAYIGATLGTFLVAALIAYAWTGAIENWFKYMYPDGKKCVKARFISALIITVIAILALKMIMRVKKL